MKLYLKFFVSILAIIIFNSCEDPSLNELVIQEDSEVQIVGNPDYELETVTGYEVPELIDELIAKTGKSYSSAMSFNQIEVKGATIHTYAVNHVRTKKEIDTYTFDIEVKDTPENHIYNLVMEKKDEKITNSFVIKYVIDPDKMRDFLVSDDDLTMTSGTYTIYSLDDFIFDSEIGKIGNNGDCSDGVLPNTGSGTSTYIPPGNDFIFNYQDVSLSSYFNYGNNSNLSQYYFSQSVNYQYSNGNSTVSTSSTVNASSLDGVFAIQSGAWGSQSYAWEVPGFGLQSFSITWGVSEGGGSADNYDCVATMIITTTFEGRPVIQITPCTGGTGAENKLGVNSKNTYCETSDGGISINTVSRSVKKLSFWLETYLGHQLNENEYNWLLNPSPHPISVAYDINQQIIANGRTQANMEVALGIIDAGTRGYLASHKPFIKFPEHLKQQYKNQYPKLYEYLRNQLPNVANYPKITDALMEYTGLPLNVIQKHLQWNNDSGPELYIVQLDNFCETCSVATAGFYDDENPENFDNIYLDIDKVNQLENGTVDDMDAYIFWIGTTILHEFTHWGENNNPVPVQCWCEEGNKFEIRAYGWNVQPDNARFILDRVKN